MIISLIQPQFAPNLYDLVAMIRADRVILLDNHIWSRKGRTHREMITRSEWINIPIKKEDKKKQIREVRIDNSKDWFTPFWNGIYHNFHSSMYFDFYEDELKALFDEIMNIEFLIDFNLIFFNKLLQFLEIDLNFELSSSSYFNLDEYNVVYQEYQSKNYIHRLRKAQTIEIDNPEIVSIAELSMLHLLFHHGPESFKLIDLLK